MLSLKLIVHVAAALKDLLAACRAMRSSQALFQAVHFEARHEIVEWRALAETGSSIWARQYGGIKCIAYAMGVQPVDGTCAWDIRSKVSAHSPQSLVLRFLAQVLEASVSLVDPYNSVR